MCLCETLNCKCWLDCILMVYAEFNILKLILFQIDKDDKLSKLVCTECLRKLDDTKKFIDSCIDAEKKQLMYLAETLRKKNAKEEFSTKDKASHFRDTELYQPVESHNMVSITETAVVEDKSDENDSFKVFCSICQRTVKLTALLRSECHEGSVSCFLCSTSVDDCDSLLDHLKIHFMEIVADKSCISWKCTKCETVSNDGGLFEKHFKIHDIEEQERKSELQQKQIHRCHICSKSFRCKTRLEFHLRFHEKGAKAGQCSECRKEFTTELCLYKHMLYNHLDPKVFTCEHCGRSFRNKSSLTYHFRSHSSLEAMKPFMCEICKKRFARKNILRDHMMNRHGSGMEPQPKTCYQCHVCKEVFPNTESAVPHMEIHHPEKVGERRGYHFDMLTISKLFICEFCDKCFSRPANLIEHRLQHGDIAKYQCKLCNEEFCSFVELKSHQESHVADGIADYKIDFNISMLFMCEYCEKCFKNFQAFNVHRKGHIGETPYQCRFCPQVFPTYIESANHRLTNHVSEKNSVFTVDCLKPFECQYCSKAFTSSSALTKHIRVHTGEKPFPCRICNKSFAQSSGLYTHLKVHSNDRPYQCDLCNRSFKIIGDYKQHVRRHSGLRSYICDICKKSFITQRSFSQHKKIHLNVRPYVCDVCQQSFRRSHTLKIHKLRHAKCN